MAVNLYTSNEGYTIITKYSKKNKKKNIFII